MEGYNIEKEMREAIEAGENALLLGSKGILPLTDAYELLRCKAAHAILQTFEIR